MSLPALLSRTLSVVVPLATSIQVSAQAPARARQGVLVFAAASLSDALTEAGILGSVGSVGDAYDNALAESFVDSFKTELIADRVWRSRSQLELAIVEYVAWFNTSRLHEALDDMPPSEFEALHAPQDQIDIPI